MTQFPASPSIGPATVGPLFMIGMPGPDLDPDTASLIRSQAVGGVILFRRNIRDPLQLASLCTQLQECALNVHGVPLLLAVDQEGGRVSRLKPPFTQFPGNEAMGRDPEPLRQARAFARITAREMRLVGLNMDCAPVMDVGREALERHLMGRILSDQPEMVGRLGRAIIRGLQSGGVMAVAKHFPGLGTARLDPHQELPVIDAPAEDLWSRHIAPFTAAIAEGVAGIMTSHALYPALDPHRPPTLSGRIMETILRAKMGFRNLIVTDDLEMGAISKQWGVVRAAVMAAEAGADLLLICSDQSAARDAMALLARRMAGDARLSRGVEASLARITAIKGRYLEGLVLPELAAVEGYFQARA